MSLGLYTYIGEVGATWTPKLCTHFRDLLEDVGKLKHIDL